LMSSVYDFSERKLVYALKPDMIRHPNDLRLYVITQDNDGKWRETEHDPNERPELLKKAMAPLELLCVQYKVLDEEKKSQKSLNFKFDSENML